MVCSVQSPEKHYLDFFQKTDPAGDFSPVFSQNTRQSIHPLYTDMRPETEADMDACWEFVRGFERFSLCDWPGRNACVLFLGGCSLRCPSCHNAELAWRPHRLPPVRRDKVEARVRAVKGWLDGIVISGGEPTESPELFPLLEEVGKFGLPVKVDTNGMQPDVVRRILEQNLAQAFSVDVKGPFAKYPLLTGNRVDEETARKRLQAVFRLAEGAPDAFCFRLTRVPCLTDQDVAEARAALPPGFTLTIQEYQPPRRNHAQPNT